MAMLEPTGERVIEDRYHDSPGRYLIYLMHAASYRYAQTLAVGKRVLDLGCGSGYGAAMIAETASSVVAVDVAQDAIDYARLHYSRPNLEFRRIDPTATLPFASQSFDLVLSFQVIEHVEDDVAYLRRAHTALTPGGRLILVTPDRRYRLLPGMRPWNRWHVREYDDGTLLRRATQVFGPGVKLRYMNLRADVAHFEIDRYRRLKWLAIPFTLPFLPPSWRTAGLNFAHRLDRLPITAKNAFQKFGFDESVVSIDDVPSLAVNLVVSASKSLPEESSQNGTDAPFHNALS